MTGVRKFEELRVWQKARLLVNSIYEVTGVGQFSKDFGLRDQIRRAAGSIMHNIAEGFDAGSDMEFKRFLNYSSRSATETQSQLYTSLDQSYITQSQFDELYSQCVEIKKDLRKFISYLNTYKRTREESAPYLINEGADFGLWTSD